MEYPHTHTHLQRSGIRNRQGQTWHHGPILTVKLREVVHQVGVGDLLLQKVLLVKEEDDRGVLEPGICDNGPEQSLALLHTVLRETCRVGDRGTKGEVEEKKQGKQKFRLCSGDV